MATYYFLNTELDESWETNNNWWDAPVGGNQGTVPTSSDDAVILGNCSYASGRSIVNLTIDGSTLFSAIITVTGVCTVQNLGILGDGAILDGNVLVTTDGTLGYGSVTYVNGTVTFEYNGSTSGPSEISTNIVLASNWTGVVGLPHSVNVVGDIIFDYGWSGSEGVTITGSGNRLYANYPTLYYNNATNDYDWGNSNNWWVDSLYTQKSSSFPTATQDVYLYGNVLYDGTSSATASDIYVNGSYTIDISISANSATFGGLAKYGSYPGSPAVSLSVTSGITLNDSSNVAINATINGDANFYSTSSLDGSINGSLVVHSPKTIPFDSSSGNNGTYSSIYYVGYPSRTMYFYSVTMIGDPFDWSNLNNWWDDSAHTTQSSYLPLPGLADDIIVEHDMTVNSGNDPTIINSLTVNNVDVSIDINACNYAVFNNNSSFGFAVTTTLNQTGSPPSLPITFSDFSTNYGNINPVSLPVVFEDHSSNYGSVYGAVDVYYPVSLPLGGSWSTINYIGYTYYFNDTASDGDWSNPVNWSLNAANTVSSGVLPSETMPGENVILQANIYNTAPGYPTAYNLINDSHSITNISIIVYGLATFSSAASLGAYSTISGNCLFKDTSVCIDGTITGVAKFELTAAAEMIYNGYNGGYAAPSNIQFEYGKGVNGSSILGIV